MSQTPELLPCPWCHEKPSLTSGYSQQGATVECVQEKCPLNPGAYVNARPGENSSLLIDEARQEAIRKWNTRAQPAVDEALAQSTQSPVDQPSQPEQLRVALVDAEKYAGKTAKKFDMLRHMKIEDAAYGQIRADCYNYLSNVRTCIRDATAALEQPPQTVAVAFTYNDFDLCCVGKDEQGNLLYAFDKEELAKIKAILTRHEGA